MGEVVAASGPGAFAGPPNAADPAGFPTYVIRAWRDRQVDFDETQPKLTARYTFTDEVSGYISWGRGFKTGGFNPFGTEQLLKQYNPASTVGDGFPKEVADTWEIGAKTVWLDNRLMFNVAYFDTQTDNSQLLEFFPAATRSLFAGMSVRF